MSYNEEEKTGWCAKGWGSSLDWGHRGGSRPPAEGEKGAQGADWPGSCQEASSGGGGAGVHETGMWLVGLKASERGRGRAGGIFSACWWTFTHLSVKQSPGLWHLPISVV